MGNGWIHSIMFNESCVLPFAAILALMFLLAYIVRVLTEMTGQRTALRKALIADGTFVRLVLKVYANVALQLDQCCGETNN